MKLDDLRLKRLREALAKVRELRHTTHAARRHVAAAIRLQRVPARKLGRKLSQLDAMLEGVKGPRLEYDPADYVSDLLTVLDSEVERLSALERNLTKWTASIAKRKPPTTKERKRS